MKNIIRSLAIAIAVTALGAAMILPVTPAQAANANEVRLRARMSGDSPASGKADYRERMKKDTLEQRFSVQIEDAEPGSQLGVFVNGQQFALIFVDELGMGEIQFRTETFIDEPGDGAPIPTDFPQLQAGDTVAVGDHLFGVFDPN